MSPITRGLINILFFIYGLYWGYNIWGHREP